MSGTSGVMVNFWVMFNFTFIGLKQNVKDYEGIVRAARGNTKAMQLAAQLILRFFKFFPSLSSQAIETHFDLCEEEEFGVSI